MTVPKLSILIPARALDQPDLQRLVKSIKRQTFKDYEIIIETRGNSEEAKAMAALRATGDILGFFCADNDLRDKHFLDTMVWYASRPDATGSYTAQYDYVSTDTALSRYFALLGANDPLCWWLGKADRRDYLSNGQTSECRKFDTSRDADLPSLGDNGFFVKRHLYLQANFTPDTFGSCMCVCTDLKRQGYARYWVVAEQKVWHRTGDDWLGYFRRRYVYVRNLYFKKQPIRRWHMVTTSRDWLSACGFALASLVVVPHLYVALRGYLRHRDCAWFCHPVVCLGLTLTYSLAWVSARLSLSRPTTVQRN